MNLTEVRAQLNEMLSSTWADIQRMNNDNIRRASERYPKAYRNCKVMELGKDTAFRYYESKTARRGQLTRWCYSKHRNAAGFYLSWIEVWKGSNGARTAFIGWDTKVAAIDNCRERLKDSRKPKVEQRYTIPSYKKAASH